LWDFSLGVTLKSRRNLITAVRDNQLKGLYYVEGKDFEVDFYDEVNSRLIQVTLASDKVEVREIKGILKANELLRVKELVVIAHGIEGKEEREGKEIKNDSNL
jgi:predicted AAA+ superfamily ATPase